MAVPSAPSITSVTLSAGTVGEPITATVAWTGFPRSGVAYQWMRGATPIAGSTGASITPTDTWDDLNCLVTIDNGRGTATAASVFATIEAAPAPAGPTAFTSGFSEGFQ